MKVIICTFEMPDRCGAFFHDYVAAKHLMSRGHTVLFVFMHRNPGIPVTLSYRGVPCKHFSVAEKDFQASDIWTTPHYPILAQVRKLNERYQKPIVITAHFGENLNVFPYVQGGKWSEAVLFMSQFMKQNIESRVKFPSFVRRTDVMYPIMSAVDITLPEVRPDAAYVTLVNGNLLKGVDIFLRTANELKDVRFLGVRPYYRPVQVHDTSNVTWEDYRDDIRTILMKTRILMVPSVTESWSRIAFEAMYNGIPVIYTKPYESSVFPGGTTQAIAEWIGDAAIACNRENLQEWVDAVQMLQDPDTYREWSEKAKERARGMNIFQYAEKYEAFLKSFARDFPSMNGTKREEVEKPRPNVQAPHLPRFGRAPQGSFSLVSGVRR